MVAVATVRYRPRGAAKTLFADRSAELLIEGPAGTGKTFACLFKLHAQAMKYAGMRGLILRKTQVSLTASALVTYTTRVLGADPRAFGVTFFGGSKIRPAQFVYPNGSTIVIGGLDKASKVMSTEYDVIYVNEATELSLEEWELIGSRLRAGNMAYTQLLADANPGPPSHWLNQRCESGLTMRLLSRHRDNPILWDSAIDAWTDAGERYVVDRLGKLTGVRRLRLVEGIWAAAEGMIYEEFDPAIHVVDRFPIPAEWPRYWVIDFGYVHPFVWQWWALDPDGRAYCYREIYRTERLVVDHVADGLAASGDEPGPRVVITDHDAEDRATFERAARRKTTPAVKNVSAGIQLVANRLRPAGDGRPRLFYLRDSVLARDRSLVEQGLPTSTIEEYASYIWDTRSGRRKGEEPVKEHDHGMDTTRYFVMHLDGPRREVRFL